MTENSFTELALSWTGTPVQPSGKVWRRRTWDCRAVTCCNAWCAARDGSALLAQSKGQLQAMIWLLQQTKKHLSR